MVGAAARTETILTEVLLRRGTSWGQKDPNPHARLTKTTQPPTLCHRVVSWLSNAQQMCPPLLASLAPVINVSAFREACVWCRQPPTHLQHHTGTGRHGHPAHSLIAIIPGDAQKVPGSCCHCCPHIPLHPSYLPSLAQAAASSGWTPPSRSLRSPIYSNLSSVPHLMEVAKLTAQLRREMARSGASPLPPAPISIHSPHYRDHHSGWWWWQEVYDENPTFLWGKQVTTTTTT